MSLMVWLPLNGSLENKGACETTTAVTSTQTWVTTGKIGAQSLYTKTRQTTMYFPQLVGTTTYSVAYWLYIPSATAPTAWADMFGIGFVCGSNTYYERDERREANTAGLHGYHMAKDPTAGSTTNGYLGLGNRSAAKDTWAHYVLTKDDTSSKLYENGVLVTTVANSNFENTPRTMTGNVYLGDSGCEAYLNDFRIYNHCLSPAEVHEISQGLVLHYKLNDISCAAPNLLINSLPSTGTLANWSSAGTGWGNTVVTYGQTQVIRNTYTGTSKTSGGIHHPTSVNKTTLTTGDIYTFSGWVRASKTCQASFKNELMVDAPFVTLTTEWQFFSATSAIDTTKQYQSNICYVQASDVTSNMWIEAKEWKLEKTNGPTGWIPHTDDTIYGQYNFNKIIDSSGYGHHGTITGTPILNSNSAHYNTSTYFANGTSAYIVTPELTFNPKTITLNIWFKSTNKSPTGDYHMLVDSNAHRQWYEVAVYKTGYFRGGLFVNGARKADNTPSTVCLDGNWHMITMSYDGANVKRYVDGTLEKSTAVAYSTGLSTPTALTIARDGPAATYAVKEAYLSDFRIYATALSDNDIQTLYEVGAKIDNLNNIHTYELVEYASNKITKTGQLHGDEFIETANSIAKSYKTNKWETNNFIEF